MTTLSRSLLALFVVLALFHGNPFGHPIGHGCFVSGSPIIYERLVCR